MQKLEKKLKLTDEKVIQFLISNAKIKEVSKKKDEANKKDSKETKGSTIKKKT